jgi:hypothetical protein
MYSESLEYKLQNWRAVLVAAIIASERNLKASLWFPMNYDNQAEACCHYYQHNVYKRLFKTAMLSSEVKQDRSTKLLHREQ